MTRLPQFALVILSVATLAHGCKTGGNDLAGDDAALATEEFALPDSLTCQVKRIKWSITSEQDTKLIMIYRIDGINSSPSVVGRKRIGNFETFMEAKGGKRHFIEVSGDTPDAPEEMGVAFEFEEVVGEKPALFLLKGTDVAKLTSGKIGGIPGKAIYTTAPGVAHETHTLMCSASGDVDSPDDVATACPTYIEDPTQDRSDLATWIPLQVGAPYDIRDVEEGLNPYGHGCYGACGASCDVTCSTVPNLEKTYRITYANGEVRYRRCGYERRMCRSDLTCRLHDECYRQKDLAQWEATKDYDKPLHTFGVNGYRVCDVGPFTEDAWKFAVPRPLLSLAQRDKVCWTYFMRGRVPSDSADCWDRSQIMYATLKTEEVVPPDCHGCDVATSIQRAGRPAAIATWKVARAEGDQGVRSGPFEAIRAVCARDGLRLPTILELKKAMDLKKVPIDGAECLWSATGSFDDKNARMVWRVAPRFATSSLPEKSCAGVCVGP